MKDFRHITLSDDFAFPEVMREPALCQCFLETLLDIRIRRIEFAEKELTLADSLLGHGIRLDVYVEDDANTVYNIEMQNRLASMKRVRYYQSSIDRRILEKGQYYADLKTSFIIMVCNHDAIGLDYPIYWRQSRFTCPVGTAEYDDGSRAVLLNARYNKKYAKDAPAVCEFLDLLNVEEDVPPEELEFPLSKMAAEGISRLRQDDEKRGAYMTFAEKLREEAYYARQEGREEGRKEGRQEGREQERNALLQMLLDQGLINEEQATRILEDAKKANTTEK